MDKLFIIVESNMSIETEECIFPVMASNKEDAILRYAEDHYSKDRVFKKFVEDRNVNGTFWDRFYSDGIFTYLNNKVVTDLTNDEIVGKFEENVGAFFGEKDLLANELLEFYYSEKSFDDMSVELKNYIAYRTVLTDYESGYHIVKEVNCHNKIKEDVIMNKEWFEEFSFGEKSDEVHALGLVLADIEELHHIDLDMNRHRGNFNKYLGLLSEESSESNLSDTK